MKTAKELVRNRVERLNRIEKNKPGAIRMTPMTWAFLYALNPELRP